LERATITFFSGRAVAQHLAVAPVQHGQQGRCSAGSVTDHASFPTFVAITPESIGVLLFLLSARSGALDQNNLRAWISGTATGLRQRSSFDQARPRFWAGSGRTMSRAGAGGCGVSNCSRLLLVNVAGEGWTVNFSMRVRAGGHGSAKTLRTGTFAVFARYRGFAYRGVRSGFERL